MSYTAFLPWNYWSSCILLKSWWISSVLSKTKKSDKKMYELLFIKSKISLQFSKTEKSDKKMSELLFIISEISLLLSEDDWLISSLLGSNISFLSNNWSFFLFKWFCLSQNMKGQVFFMLIHMQIPILFSFFFYFKEEISFFF